MKLNIYFEKFIFYINVFDILKIRKQVIMFNKVYIFCDIYCDVIF